MDRILHVIGDVPNTSRRNDDDFADRLAYRFTTILLIVFAFLVTSKQFVGDSIHCWLPAHFSDPQVDYANDYCWIRNTYHLSYDDEVPAEEEHEKRWMVTYYQWVPMILLAEALFFYLPIMLWRTMNGKCGMDVNNIVEAGETLLNTEMTEHREKTLKYMTKQMDRYLASQRDCRLPVTISAKNYLARSFCRPFGRHRGNYLIALYIGVKLLSIANVCGQLLLLNSLLGSGFHVYGVEVVRSIIRGEDWTTGSRFPRITMCDFKVRRLGNVQRYTVQCVLPINLFNEKIFFFLWLWLIFVFFTLFASILTWLLRANFLTDRLRYVKKHLYLTGRLKDDHSKKTARKFVVDYLGQDGVFILRLVGHNTNALTVTEFVCALWENYRSKSLVDKSVGGCSDEI